ncbi:hypothetical protein [Ekhidna sp.]|uniref:hypothetical protein n=1 Tax=Ekhidna sp. TaxID=2608089 RepID=UPI003B5906A2
MNLLSQLFGKKKSGSNLNLEKTDDGRWMVTRKFRILYMGTKEKCQLFMENQMKKRDGLNTSAS